MVRCCRGDGRCGGVERAELALVARRLRRGAARARSDRRRGRRAGCLGGGCRARRPRVGARAGDAMSRPRRGRAGRRRAGAPTTRGGGRASTSRSAIPSAARAPCSRSACSGGAPDRSDPAREAIEAALAGFEALGAAGWAEKARAELGRIGGRTRVEGLTAAEQRVAALVAEGRTNREVAAALFLAEPTVASHLCARLRQARRPLAHRARAQTSDVLMFPTLRLRP